MAATLTCTPGGGSDNSYISLADADAYFANGLRAEVWEAWTSDQRTRALVEATQQIERLGGSRVSTDSANRSRFRGEPYESLLSDQCLHFPRTTDLDEGGSIIVPQGVKDAVCEQAYFLLKKQDEPDLLDRADLQRQGVKSVSVDGLSESYGATEVPDGIAGEAWEHIRQYVVRNFYVRG